MNDHVIGREQELAAGSRLLEALANGPTALVLQGEAGIGKSIVWDEVVRRARERGCTVLSCRPAEAETKLSVAAGLADLVDEFADHVLRDGLGQRRPGRDVCKTEKRWICEKR